MCWQDFLMYGIGLILIFLAIRKNYEPALLLPLGFGVILVNLPGNYFANGFAGWLYKTGITSSEAMPLLLFIGIGAMTDFTPLFKKPYLAVFGVICQAGIFIVFKLAVLAGFSAADAASIGIIGSADGPTAILVSRTLDSKFSGQIALAAYSYIALVPVIQPLLVKILTSKKERMIRIPQSYTYRMVSPELKEFPRARIIFPIVAAFASGFIAPKSAELTGCLMFGNLVRECGVLERLAENARTAIVNTITLLLGLSIAVTLKSSDFVQAKTFMILGMGLMAFIFDIAAGILLVKLVNFFLRNKINPIIGSAGISAFPISSHVAQRIAFVNDSSNIILMEATAVNVSGQLFSAVMGGIMIHLGSM